MQRMIPIAAAVGILTVGGLTGPSNIDPDHKSAWTENTGWTNWRHDRPNVGDGVFVADTFLSGFVWNENVGWLNVGDGSPAGGVHYANVDASDFGVNVDEGTDDLFGLAWGENIGWVNFDTSVLGEDRARYEACNHRFFGFAWGENVGWINLDNTEHFVAIGPCASPDGDCEEDVDLDDYSGFYEALTGPEVAVDCPTFDTDGDGDVDLADFGTFQVVFTGE
jgi:hypothetical protein